MYRIVHFRRSKMFHLRDLISWKLKRKHSSDDDLRSVNYWSDSRCHTTVSARPSLKCYISSTCILPLSPWSFCCIRHLWSLLLRCLSSWFGIFYFTLQWFTSYLSSRTSAVFIPPHLSPSSHLTCIFYKVLSSVPFFLVCALLLSVLQSAPPAPHT